jgi:hypothetical protein
MLRSRPDSGDNMRQGRFFFELREQLHSTLWLLYIARLIVYVRPRESRPFAFIIYNLHTLKGIMIKVFICVFTSSILEQGYANISGQSLRSSGAVPGDFCSDIYQNFILLC